MKSSDYINATEKIQMPEDMRERISAKLKENKNVKEIKLMSKKKIITIAAAAVMAIGVIAYAASSTITSISSHSYAWDDYKTLPTAERCIKDAGYVPTLIEEFDNGYAFSVGHIAGTEFNGEGGETIEKFKSFHFDYKKGGDKVYFTCEKYSSEMEPKGELAAEENGMKIYYNSFVNKFVPADYELTEEDRRAEENGELVFSYGASEVEVMEIVSVKWSNGEMHYDLMQMNGKLSKDELVDMAKEIINK